VLEGGVEQPHHVRHLAHVGLHRDVLTARLLDPGDDLLGLLLAAGVVDDDGGTVPGQPQGDGPADAPAGPGDEGDFPSQAHGAILLGGCGFWMPATSAAPPPEPRAARPRRRSTATMHPQIK
jgi:hypothetical protein